MQLHHIPKLSEIPFRYFCLSPNFYSLQLLALPFPFSSSQVLHFSLYSCHFLVLFCRTSSPFPQFPSPPSLSSLAQQTQVFLRTCSYKGGRKIESTSHLMFSPAAYSWAWLELSSFVHIFNTIRKKKTFPFWNELKCRGLEWCRLSGRSAVLSQSL